MGCRLSGDNPLSEPMMAYCQLDHKEHISMEFVWNSTVFIQENTSENVVCKNGGHPVPASRCYILSLGY